MPNEQTRFRARVRVIELATVFGALLVLVGAIWLVVLAVDSPSSGGMPRGIDSPYAPLVLLETDLGTGSTEFSAVALNEQTNRLWIASDDDRLFEFDLLPGGEPVTPPRRTVVVDLGAGDIEGLAWIEGSSFALAHENDGRLTVVDIGDAATSIGEDDVQQVVDTGVPEIDGNGIEGVTVVAALVEGSSFAVVDERPPTLLLFGADGELERTVPLDIGVADVSDVWADTDATYLLVSDEDRLVVQAVLGPDGLVETRILLDLELDDGRFDQPEGITLSLDRRRLYVVGEAPGPGSFSFGLWLAEP